MSLGGQLPAVPYGSPGRSREGGAQCCRVSRRMWACLWETTRSNGGQSLNGCFPSLWGQMPLSSKGRDQDLLDLKASQVRVREQGAGFEAMLPGVGPGHCCLS